MKQLKFIYLKEEEEDTKFYQWLEQSKKKPIELNVEDIITSELTQGTYLEKDWKLVLDHKVRDVQLGAIPVGKVD